MKKYLVAALSLTLGLLGFVVNLLMPRFCPVSLAACERVVPGMTRAEVEAVFGGPVGDYRTRPPGLCYPDPNDGWLMVWLGGTHAAWVGDEAELHVSFHGGVAELVEVRHVVPADAGPLELVRWRLERLWAKLVP